MTCLEDHGLKKEAFDMVVDLVNDQNKVKLWLYFMTSFLCVVHVIKTPSACR